MQSNGDYNQFIDELQQYSRIRAFVGSRSQPARWSLRLNPGLSHKGKATLKGPYGIRVNVISHKTASTLRRFSFFQVSRTKNFLVGKKERPACSSTQLLRFPINSEGEKGFSKKQTSNSCWWITRLWPQGVLKEKRKRKKKDSWEGDKGCEDKESEEKKQSEQEENGEEGSIPH